MFFAPHIAAQDPPNASDAPGSIHVFNGKDLGGFYTFLKDRGRDVDPEKVFTVGDGLLRISGQELGCVTSVEEYENYHLVVEFKWGEATYAGRVNAARDSGVLVHSTGADGAYGGIWMHSIECQVIEGGTGDVLVVGDGTDRFKVTCPTAPELSGGCPVFQPDGKSVTINKGRVNWFGRDPDWKDVKGFRGKHDIEKPVGEWNRYECIAEGDRLTLILNGVVVNKCFDVQPRKGRIQIQSEGAEIFVRRVDVRPLPPSPANPHTPAGSEPPVFESAFIFDPAKESHGHVHASCIVECPDGDLRAVWYENGPDLPPPYFSKERDKSDDVRIGGSRKPKGADWETPFVMADTFGVSDNNPCMVVDRDARLWLFHAVLLAVPENTWTSALIRYHVSTVYNQPGPPLWCAENLLIVHPVGLEKTFEAAMRTRENLSEEQRQAGMKLVQSQLEDPYKTRLGWMPRAHPIIRSDGALLLPLANESLGVAAMAITKDGGATWTIGEAVPDRGLEQPTIVEFPDKSMAAFFRNDRPAHRILRSESQDGGMTWSPVATTDLPHPNAGIDALLLRDGRLLMVYNDSEKERDRLAVSISEDGGKSWAHTRHLENSPGQRFDYPSIVQGKDGTLHATYSYNLKTIKYVHFDENWLSKDEG